MGSALLRLEATNRTTTSAERLQELYSDRYRFSSLGDTADSRLNGRRSSENHSRDRFARDQNRDAKKLVNAKRTTTREQARVPLVSRVFVRFTDSVPFASIVSLGIEESANECGKRTDHQLGEVARVAYILSQVGKICSHRDFIVSTLGLVP